MDGCNIDRSVWPIVRQIADDMILTKTPRALLDFRTADDERLYHHSARAWDDNVAEEIDFWTSPLQITTEHSSWCQLVVWLLFFCVFLCDCLPSSSPVV